MYTTNLRVSYTNASKWIDYKVTINGYWITISDSDGKVIYSREPKNDDWLDASHSKIADALSKLQEALRATIESNTSQGT